jgi:hypothetical protein
MADLTKTNIKKTDPRTCCSGCGMEQKGWDDEEGLIRDGKVYCCQRCSEGSSCACG